MKLEVLASYLSKDINKLKEGYRPELIEFKEKEYLILTEREANFEAEERILDSLWAFRADWVRQFVADNNIQLSENAEVILDNLESYQEDMCEDANNLVAEIIEGYEDKFISESIAAEKTGRGHFISGYDGKEKVFNYNGETYYIYRQN